MINEIKNIDQLDALFRKKLYFADKKLLYQVYNALVLFGNNKLSAGQDIYGVCLEGPPGAGKTFFTKIYKKVASEILGTDIEIIKYSCDETTGKTELYEDINISAAISRDAAKVNIPGELVEAIHKVKEGKKVILFLDEYDKARPGTDAFLLEFLQDGRIKTTQHGILEIPEEFKNNLQVILCKNDQRENLSGPLSRRVRIIRLDFMKPEMFKKVACEELIPDQNNKDEVFEHLINFVSLIYEQAYNHATSNKGLYKRVPACSEMLLGIQDAHRLITGINVSQSVIYDTILEAMFKDQDDMEIFLSHLNKSPNAKTKELNNLLKSMKEDITETIDSKNLNDMIAESLFADSAKKLADKSNELDLLIAKYEKKFADYELGMQSQTAEAAKILLNGGVLAEIKEKPTAIGNFEDEAAYIKRGKSIFDITDRDWTDVGNMYYLRLNHQAFLDKIKEYAAKMDIKIYEDGMLLKEKDGLNLIVFQELDASKRIHYRFMTDTQVVPSTFMADIRNFIDLAKQVQKMYPTSSIKDYDKRIAGTEEINLNALIYNDKKLKLNEIKPNIYDFEFNSLNIEEGLELLKKEISSFRCDAPTKALMASISLVKDSLSLGRK